MWLQRVLFNVQRRLLGRDEERSEQLAPRSVSSRRPAERAQVFQARLLDLDRRLALLR